MDFFLEETATKRFTSILLLRFLYSPKVIKTWPFSCQNHNKEKDMPLPEGRNLSDFMRVRTTPVPPIWSEILSLHQIYHINNLYSFRVERRKRRINQYKIQDVPSNCTGFSEPAALCVYTSFDCNKRIVNWFPRNRRGHSPKKLFN